MYRLYKTAKGDPVVLSIDKIDSVFKSSDGNALVFYAGGDKGLELSEDFYTFIEQELGIE